MIPARKPENEEERISDLYTYDILDSISEKDYDDITKIAAEICGMPMSLISIIDSDRQWFKSKVGLDDPETHRDLAFCSHAILNPNDMFIVQDPSTDERFHDNPLVIGPPYIGFYAGVPLVNQSGSALGTLCVLDSQPRELTDEQKVTLRALARQVVAQLETRKKNKQLHEQKEELEQLTQDLSRFAHVVAHDVKSPISSIAMSVMYLKENYAGMFDGQGLRFLEMMEKTSMNAIEMVNGILSHTQTVNGSEIKKEKLKFADVVDELKLALVIPAEFTVETANPEFTFYTSKSMLLQVLQNLCNNAIKYNDKPQGRIVLNAWENGAYYAFSVKDNGPGIKKEDQERIFDLFTTLGTKDRFQNMGTGIGLSTVKRLTQKLGGRIEINSEPGQGSEFIVNVLK